MKKTTITLNPENKTVVNLKATGPTVKLTEADVLNGDMNKCPLTLAFERHFGTYVYVEGDNTIFRAFVGLEIPAHWDTFDIETKGTPVKVYDIPRELQDALADWAEVVEVEGLLKGRTFYYAVPADDTVDVEPSTAYLSESMADTATTHLEGYTVGSSDELPSFINEVVLDNGVVLDPRKTRIDALPPQNIVLDYQFTENE